MRLEIDPLESEMERILTERGIVFTRPDRDASVKPTVDFHLPEYGLYVEVKAYATERMVEQLIRSELDGGPVMVLVGLEAVRAFGRLLEGKASDAS